jgi:hypothetical protein
MTGIDMSAIAVRYDWETLRDELFRKDGRKRKQHVSQAQKRKAQGDQDRARFERYKASGFKVNK